MFLCKNNRKEKALLCDPKKKEFSCIKINYFYKMLIGVILKWQILQVFFNYLSWVLPYFLNFLNWACVLWLYNNILNNSYLSLETLTKFERLEKYWLTNLERPIRRHFHPVLSFLQMKSAQGKWFVQRHTEHWRKCSDQKSGAPQLSLDFHSSILLFFQEELSVNICKEKDT